MTRFHRWTIPCAALSLLATACSAPATDTHDRDGDGVADADDAFPDDPQEWADLDGDGWGSNADCDDNAPSIHRPSSWYADCDGDGAFAATFVAACVGPPSPCNDGEEPDGGWSQADPSPVADCDDESPSSFPGQHWYADCDGDGAYGPAAVVACAEPPSPCADATAPDDWTPTDPGDDADCDDADATVQGALQWFADCDGDASFSGAILLSCSEPTDVCADANPPDGGWSQVTPTPGDCNDEDANEYPGQRWYPDCDGDLAANTMGMTSCAMPGAAFCGDGEAPDGGWTSAEGTDCDDNDATEFPGQTYYPDCDGDSFFSAAATLSCSTPTTSPCADGGAPDGGWQIDAPASADCDDDDEARFPGQSWYADCDADAAFAATAIVACTDPVTPCADASEPDGGWSASDPAANADCDDEDGALFPTQVWFPDCDGDLAFAAPAVVSCPEPAPPCLDTGVPDGGWSHVDPAGASDCDDEEPTVYPGQSWFPDCDGDGAYREPAIVSCGQPADSLGACASAAPPAGGWVRDHLGNVDCLDADPTTQLCQWQTFWGVDGVRDLHADATQLWVASDGGLKHLDFNHTPHDRSDDTWTIFRFADGAPNGPASLIHPDGSGGYWLAYWSGLVHLDAGGTPADPADDLWTIRTSSAGLGLGDVSALAQETNGGLWIGTDADHDALRYLDVAGTPADESDDTWVTFFDADGPPAAAIGAILIDAGGGKWISTTDSGLAHLSDGGTPTDKTDDAWTVFALADGLSTNYVGDRLAIDGSDGIWIGQTTSVLHLDIAGTPGDKTDDTYTAFTAADGLCGNPREVWSENDIVWVATLTSVCLLDPNGTPADKTDDAWLELTEADGLRPSLPSTASEPVGSGRWVGSGTLGMTFFDDAGTPTEGSDDQWTAYASIDGLSHSEARAGPVVDAANRKWLSTRGRVLNVLDDGGTPLDKSDDLWGEFLQAETVKVIAIDAAGDKWLGTAGDGLIFFDDGGDPFDGAGDSSVTFTILDGLADQNINGIAIDGRQKWIATPAGLSYFHDGGTPAIPAGDVWVTFTAADGLLADATLSVALDGSAGVWIASVGGLSYLDHNGTPALKGDDLWTTFSAADGITGFAAQALVVDPSGELWFGTDQLYHLDTNGTPAIKTDDTLTTFDETNGFTAGWPRALAFSTGAVWVATWEGVSVLFHNGTIADHSDDVWQSFDARSGLSDEAVWGVAFDQLGTLWMTSDNGFTCLSRQ